MVPMSCTVNFSLIRMVSQSLLSPLGPPKNRTTRWGRGEREGGWWGLQLPFFIAGLCRVVMGLKVVDQSPLGFLGYY